MSTKAAEARAPALRWAWPALFACAVGVYLLVLPLAELTSDDGAWLLDAWLRLREHDWFNPWISTSQGIKNLPLVSWFLAAALVFKPSVFSVQFLVLLTQLGALEFIRRVAARLGLYSRGLVAGTLFVLLPALCLNYSTKVCNTSFTLLAGAFLLWSYVCHEGRKRLLLTAIGFVVAMQVHFSFGVYLPLLLLGPISKVLPRGLSREGSGDLSRQKVALGAGGLAAALMLLACLLPSWFPHLRSLVDILAPGSGYMTSRSVAIGDGAPPKAFLPWELIPFLIALLMVPVRAIGNSPAPRAARELWFSVAIPIFVLATFGLWGQSAPHHWLLPWVPGCLLLLEMGIELLSLLIGPSRGRQLAVAALVLCVGLAGAQSVYVGTGIAKTGGTGWHGPSVTMKRQILFWIAEHAPESDLVLAVPGAEWTGSLTGWTALASLPAEFAGKVMTSSRVSSPGVILIDERGTEGSDPTFATQARARGMQPVFEVGNVRLWSMKNVSGTWPRIRTILSRAK